MGTTLSFLLLNLFLKGRKISFVLSPVTEISEVSEPTDSMDRLDTTDPGRLFNDNALLGMCVEPYISVSGPTPILCSAQSAPALSSSSVRRRPTVNFKPCKIYLFSLRVSF